MLKSDEHIHKFIFKSCFEVYLMWYVVINIIYIIFKIIFKIGPVLSVLTQTEVKISSLYR